MLKQIEFYGILIIVVGVLSFIGLQSYRINSLSKEVVTLTETTKRQSAAITTLETGIAGLQNIDSSRKDNRTDRDSSNAKMTKDSKRESVVAAKPGLVEKQINNSFDKFAQDLQELTK